MVRYLLLGLVACLCALAAGAEEKINRFDVDISVQADGDIVARLPVRVTMAAEETRVFVP